MAENTYVIMDMEWVDTAGDIPCPIQLAALRVNKCWKCLDMFSSLVKPADPSVFDQPHIAFKGTAPDDFLSADDAETVFRSLDDWLQDDDILLWWADEPANTFRMITLHLSGRKLARKMHLLSPIAAEICNSRKNAYELARKRGIKVPSPQHVSSNDVEAIRRLMAHLKVDPSVKPLPLVPAKKKKPSVPARLPYRYDPAGGLLHTVQGGCLSLGIQTLDHATIKSCIKKKLKPCPVCCAKVFHLESAKLTEEVISHTAYNFIYSGKSDVFHTAECAYTKNMFYRDVRGAVSMDTCIKNGKHPCKVCKPHVLYRRPAKTKAVSVPGVPKAILPGMTRMLSHAEQRAWDRYTQSKQEREDQNYAAEDKDAVTRTNPMFAFWSAQGYSNFHISGCPKLAGLKNLRGFSRCHEAINRGLSPCRQCRPTKKHDISITVFKGGQLRDGETTDILDALCEAHGYEHSLQNSRYYIATPVGKWRLHIDNRPLELWHINLLMRGGGNADYHRQPKLLLSLQDAFHYIHGHDKALLKKRSIGCI